MQSASSSPNEWLSHLAASYPNLEHEFKLICIILKDASEAGPPRYNKILAQNNFVLGGILAGLQGRWIDTKEDRLGDRGVCKRQ